MKKDRYFSVPILLSFLALICSPCEHFKQFLRNAPSSNCRSVECSDDAGAAHAAADAKSCKTGLGACSLHVSKQSNEDTAAGSAYGMSESDCTAGEVQLVEVELQILADCDRLCCKCLILHP